jgi:hypothetical protein
MRFVVKTSPLPKRQGVLVFSWDLYTFGLVALFLFFQLASWTLLPKFLDIYYHLGVVKGFDEAGGYVGRAFWEAAPAGRPHLYPPLLHVLMWHLYKAGLPLVDLGRLIDAVSFPVLLATVWGVLRRLYNPRIAFFTVLFLSSSYSALLAASTLPAFNLALVIGLWGILAVHRDKPVGAAVGLGLCFYAHTLAGWMFFLAAALYVIFRQGPKFIFFCALAGALIFSSPLLIHQWQFRNLFVFLDLKENYLLEFDASFYLAALGGAAIAWKRKGAFGIPLCLILASLPMARLYPVRFTSGQGILPFVMLSGFFADFIFDRWTRRWKSGTAVLSFLIPVFFYFAFLAPVFSLNLRA